MSKVFELGIIGLGPSGIGAAMSLRGTHLIGETVCFEHGASLGNNRCSLLANKECCQWTPCHVVSGIGGSSNNSSGKISDYPAGSGLVPFFESEAHLKSMLSSLIETLERDIGLKKVNIESDIINLTEDYYRSKNITYKYYDVYEFDGIKYRQYISEIIDTLVSEGLCVKMNTEITNLEYDRDTALYTVTAKTESKETQYSCRKIILGTGSMRLFEGLIQTLVGKQANSYEIGVRVEGPTEAFKHIFDVHGDLKLKYGMGRTYCVTKNGKIISYRVDDLCFLEGCIDQSEMTDYSNLAILIKSTDELAVSSFLRQYKTKYSGLPIKQKYTDYMANIETRDCLFETSINAKNGNISELLPQDINYRLKEFFRHVIEDAMNLDVTKLSLVAPEIKLMRNIEIADTFEVQPGLYLIGAATGKFRGILQSLCSGMQCVHNILRG